MFAYCRNNPVRRIDISGAADADCVDDDPLDEEDILKSSQGGGVSQSSGSNAPVNGASDSSGYGKAPKQGIPGSTYTQYSSDGKNTVVSKTTYNNYGVRESHIDYQGRDHGVGLPHIHVLSWGIRDGRVVPTGKEKVSLYRIE
jgi:hypothetical protein